VTGEGYLNNGNDRWNIQGHPKNIKWSATSSMPFVDRNQEWLRRDHNDMTDKAFRCSSRPAQDG
jgi:hypothetical protein